jgi:hypothetical protein
MKEEDVNWSRRVGQELSARGFASPVAVEP